MEAILLILTRNVASDIESCGKNKRFVFHWATAERVCFKEKTKNNAIYQSRIHGDGDGKKTHTMRAQEFKCHNGLQRQLLLTHSIQPNKPKFLYVPSIWDMSWGFLSQTKCKQSLRSLIPWFWSYKLIYSWNLTWLIILASWGNVQYISDELRHRTVFFRRKFDAAYAIHNALKIIKRTLNRPLNTRLTIVNALAKLCMIKCNVIAGRKQ